MFAYQLRMALKGIRRNPVLSSLMVAAIGIGIGVCMTAITVFYLMSDNPIPHKSESLYSVQLDSWDATEPFDDEDPEGLPKALTYRDAKALLASGSEARQVAMYESGATLDPQNPDVNPMLASLRFTTGDFFSMFDVPFLYGSGWDSEADDNATNVAVLSFETNEEIFGGENSVGQTITLDTRVFTVVGVMQHWEPVPRFYAAFNGAFQETDDVFLPFLVNEGWQQQSFGNTICWGDTPVNSYQEFLNSECIWVEFWAELPNPDMKAQYMSWLTGYIAEQQRIGRFPIEQAKAELRDVMEWLEYNKVVSTDFRVLIGLALMFLAVCLLNTVALLLAKIAGDAPRVGLFRALGASKAMIFRQNLVEVGIIGIGGGALGLGLARLGLWGVKIINRGRYDQLVSMDGELITFAILVSLLAAIIAGLYPTWRICQLSPATYLKTQ